MFRIKSSNLGARLQLEGCQPRAGSMWLPAAARWQVLGGEQGRLGWEERGRLGRKKGDAGVQRKKKLKMEGSERGRGWDKRVE